MQGGQVGLAAAHAPHDLLHGIPASLPVGGEVQGGVAGIRQVQGVHCEPVRGKSTSY